MRILAHEAAGKLILRLAVGGTVLLHGLAKLTGGIDHLIGMVTGAGLPAAFAYAVLLGEVAGPLAMIAGFYARIGALLVTCNMLVAVWLAHQNDLFTLTPQGGWTLELQALMLFGALASMLLGPGRFAFNDR